jgi:hypothetical protein
MAAFYEQLIDRRFWERRAPAFHIADVRFLQPDDGMQAPDALAAAAAGLAGEGYAQLRGLALDADFDGMARVARALAADGLDPVFCFVYDEFWRPYFKLDALFRSILGPYNFLPDFWAWSIAPGAAGWAPHRDRGRHALRDDGTPVSLTCWIAIGESTPLNGCLYIVPKHLDPTYGTESEGDWRFDHASIRALPAQPGDVLVWDQAVMHWGGRSSPRAQASRVSMSFEVQRLDVPSAEAPLIAPWQIVPFEERLRLIGAKLLHYRHMHPIAPEMERLAERLSG